MNTGKKRKGIPNANGEPEPETTPGDDEQSQSTQSSADNK